jgi:hypothetical protein
MSRSAAVKADRVIVTDGAEQNPSEPNVSSAAA